MDRYQALAETFLEEALKKSGLSRSALAKKLGFAHTTFTRTGAKNAKHTMSLRTALSLSEEYGIPLPSVTDAAHHDGKVVDRLDQVEVRWLKFWRDLERPEKASLLRVFGLDGAAERKSV